MKPITIEDVEWSIECLPEDTPIRGNVLASGDDEEDHKAEQWVEDQLDCGNCWAWCCVKVTGYFEGLAFSDYLGCCSYLSQEDFENGGYYDDMRSSILDQISDTINRICERVI